jgi:hypothetical protein
MEAKLADVRYPLEAAEYASSGYAVSNVCFVETQLTPSQLHQISASRPTQPITAGFVYRIPVTSGVDAIPFPNFMVMVEFKYDHKFLAGCTPVRTGAYWYTGVR